MSRFHVCFFNRSFHPDAAATGQLLTQLAEDLVHRHGCRVTVVCGGAAATSGRSLVLFQRDRYRGIEILRALGTQSSKRGFAGRFSNYVSYFLSACYAGLRIDRPDVVVALTDPPIIGLTAYLAARRFRAPLVMWYQDVFPEVGRLLEDFRSETVNGILQRVNCFLARKADRIVVLGEAMRRRLIEGKGADPDKTVIIENWADCAVIVPGDRRNPFSLAHGLADSFVVMHSGNLGLSQGLETLVQAAGLLEDQGDIQVVFVGEGIKKPALQAQVESLGLKNVRFLPHQPMEAVRDSFASADVFVISLKAGLAGCIVPSKLYGILAAGRPYVAGVEEACEVTEVTRKHDCGLLARPGDPQDLAEKILMLRTQPALAQRLAVNARKASLEFNRSVKVRSHHDLLCDVALGPRPTPLVKRSFDILLSGLGLLGSAPLWLLIAASIKADDGGPVFYGQDRVGRGTRPFRSWKFRSMIPDADAKFGPLQAKSGDARVTRLGRLLRATALDELPQLWNILKGDMSFVGPRALLPAEIEVHGEGRSIPIEAIPGYRARHRVSPGLTGLAQIYAARDVPRRTKFRYDLLYIGRQSFWLDLRLIFLSFWITARGAWERRGPKL